MLNFIVVDEPEHSTHALAKYEMKYGVPSGLLVHMAGTGVDILPDAEIVQMWIFEHEVNCQAELVVLSDCGTAVAASA